MELCGDHYRLFQSRVESRRQQREEGGAERPGRHDRSGQALHVLMTTSSSAARRDHTAPGRSVVSYLIDTNVISELRMVGAEDTANFFISAITILELERGVLSVQRRDAVQGARLRAWLDNHIRLEFSGRVLPVDDEQLPEEMSEALPPDADRSNG